MQSNQQLNQQYQSQVQHPQYVSWESYCQLFEKYKNLKHQNDLLLQTLNLQNNNHFQPVVQFVQPFFNQQANILNPSFTRIVQPSVQPSVQPVIQPSVQSSVPPSVQPVVEQAATDLTSNLTTTSGFVSRRKVRKPSRINSGNSTLTFSSSRLNTSDSETETDTDTDMDIQENQQTLQTILDDVSSSDNEEEINLTISDFETKSLGEIYQSTISLTKTIVPTFSYYECIRINRVPLLKIGNHYFIQLKDKIVKYKSATDFIFNYDLEFENRLDNLDCVYIKSKNNRTVSGITLSGFIKLLFHLHSTDLSVFKSLFSHYKPIFNLIAHRLQVAQN